ncbi:TIM barrel protein [Roseobacter sp. YSTF-M11]|uniref:TIM barrel protein n=1 Tax=Roseobacter insulae TaxID=2859783 RepID=A0A9X1FSG1_9RHOB|nr:TIM barrel protein [Roseobacter insulae]MBW4706880.1 TIM barrel protein [Roseobacter insulae]
MFKIAANLSHLWPELPYLDRFGAAADAGFDGVEVLFPYDMPAKDTQRALMRCGLPMVLINAPPPNYTGGPRGFAAVPGSQARFRFDLRRAVRYCDALRVPTLHIMAGVAHGPDARATLLENLAVAADTVPDTMTLTLEPLNGTDMPGYFLDSFDLAVEILEELQAPNVGLQFDTYHAQMIHGDCLAVFEAHRKWVRHIQIGDAPGRSPPFSGQVDFDRFFAAVGASGYAGWISAEYTPTMPTEDSLGWLQALRR